MGYLWNLYKILTSTNTHGDYLRYINKYNTLFIFVLFIIIMHILHMLISYPNWFQNEKKKLYNIGTYKFKENK